MTNGQSVKAQTLVGLMSACMVAANVQAGVHNVKLDTSPDRQRTGLSVDMKRIGTVAPRSVYDIGSCGKWSVGCEILDRDFADFKEYCEFYEPLGIRSVRLQSGWAKTERVRGVYDFKWLDGLVDFFHARGFEIMIEPGYCNPIYDCGGAKGGWDLGTGFPRTEEGLAAWDRYVTKLVDRYRDRVSAWSMWNEASNLWDRKGRPEYAEPEESARFCNRTAKLVLSRQPEARIAIFTLGSDASKDPKGRFLERALPAIPKEDLARYTWIIVHGYCYRPEDAQPGIDRIRALIAEFAPNLKIRQGEQGCPSEGIVSFALPYAPWSEISQAKWFMRRMLFDCGNGIQSHVYTMSDFVHEGVYVNSINNKGLIRGNLDRETIGVKRSYYAVQNVVSVFDDTVNLSGRPAFTNFDWTIRFNEYAKPDGRPVLAFWCDKEPGGRWFHDNPPGGGRPGDSFETRPTVFFSTAKPMEHPVWVDLFSGRIYELPASDVQGSRSGTMYVNVPVYDSPCLLTERSVVIDDVKPPTVTVEEMVRKAKSDISTYDAGPKVKRQGVMNGSAARQKGLDI